MNANNRTPKQGAHTPQALRPDIVVAVECIRAAVKKHAAVMLRASKARTPLDREDCHRLIGEAARALDGAHQDLDTLLMEE